MRSSIFLYVLVLSFCSLGLCKAQETALYVPAAPLFQTEDPLALKFQFSGKELKRETNDSTYLKSDLWYKIADAPWDSMQVKIRARGIFRRSQCYFTPIRIKFKKRRVKETLFADIKKTKVVLPCKLERGKDDLVLKEYMAYKLYEVVTPYHLKTKLAQITYSEVRGKRTRDHQLTGFLIEDMDNLEDRSGGKEVKREVHPRQQDDYHSVLQDFFQFMIGNTDYSTSKLHNEKLFYIDEKILPVPYDFDMSGLVNAPYATVSNTQRLPRDIGSVTERAYKGYDRGAALREQLRSFYLDKEAELLAVADSLQNRFEDPREYRSARSFLESFFEILRDDQQFERYFIKYLRTD
ncbi:hypothetical protein [Robiginitalea sp. IMCC43444]|uniref:hypothetical protein n=1 Tax=Robiginitalea sp. IMCC43444 TaxID=3459121 RepID=UPI004042BAF7